MIKKENGGFEFEPKDAKIEQEFIHALDVERGTVMAMDALVRTMSMAQRGTSEAWAKVRKCIADSAVWPDDYPDCTDIGYSRSEKEVYFTRDK